MSKRTFTRPADFSIKQHLGGAFGVFTGPGDHVIRLRFDTWAAGLVRERFWHESQRLVDVPSGGVDMELRLGTLEENVDVSSPKELRRRVSETARQIAAKYPPT